MDLAQRFYWLPVMVLLLACTSKPKSEFERLSEADQKRAREMLRAKRAAEKQGTDVGNLLLCTYDQHEVPDILMLDSAIRLGGNVNCDCFFQGKRLKTGAKIPVVKDFIQDKTKSVAAIRHPLERAVAKRDSTAVRYLLEQGADPNRSVYQKNRPLHRALQNAFKAGGAYEEQVAIAKILVSHGASLDSQFIDAGLDVKQIQLFADFGADFNTLSHAGHAAIHSAARLGPEEVVEVLLSNGADPNLQNRRGESALHIAVGVNDRTGLIGLLLKAGADLYITDDNGDEPIMRAARRSYVNYSYLLQYYDPSKSVHSKEDLQRAIDKTSK